MIASKIYRDLKPVLFNPIGSLQLCMANEGIPTDKVQTHIGPVWDGLRTVWIREFMERDKETKACHSDDFPAAPFKHLRHLSPSLMLPNFDFLLLMRLYVQMSLSVSLFVWLCKSQPKLLKSFSWLNKLWEINTTEHNGCWNESCHCSGFAKIKYFDHLISKTSAELNECQTGITLCHYF